ncbi:hypothetical protein [Micromonospora sp. NPDC005806]|uniref:hypothetical protein n=1 Tax=Micromonospora sp. NPDC005806 TaxID=3364234 RepID=UPI003687DAFA
MDQGECRRVPHVLVGGPADGPPGPDHAHPLKLGAALLATIPVAIIFVVFQRYFVRDANEGTDKG